MGSRGADLGTVLRMPDQQERNVLGADARSIAWSADVIGFLRGATSEHELGIHDVADALRLTLRVWLAGPASNHWTGLP